MLSLAPAIVLALALVVQHQAASAQPCAFVLGFAVLHERIPDLVGICTGNVQYDPVTGDGVQATSSGLLVWRKSDNLTAFTNGSDTWLDGPFGVQMRLNSQRYSGSRIQAIWPSFRRLKQAINASRLERQ
jgi:hypothetical protein